MKKHLRLKAITDGKAAARYAPVAGKMLCLVEQCNTLEFSPRDIIKQRIIGNTLESIAKPIGCTRERVRQLETDACKNLFLLHQPLVSKWLELKKAKFTPKENITKQKEYFRKNRAKIRARIRKYYANPKVRKRFNKYQISYRKRPEVKPKIDKYMREYYKKYYRKPKIRNKLRKYAREHMRKYYKTAKYK